MRILKFNIRNQKIEKDKTCDFSNIARGTNGYLVAKFSFTPDWSGYTKVGVFRTIDGQEVAVPVTGNMCIIPSEALKERMFYAHVIGMKDGAKIVSEKTEVYQS